MNVSVEQEIAINEFVQLWQERIDAYMQKQFPTLKREVLKVRYGKKYAKVIKSDASVYAFIDLSTGDIFKPASWQKPAPHARGNVNSKTQGMEAVDAHGYIKYLR